MRKDASVKFVGLIVVFFILCFLVGCQRVPDNTRQQDANVFISPIRVNIGNVLQYNSSSAQCILRNASNDPIEIVKLVASCACTNGSTSKSQLQPGESAQINIKINAGNRTGDFGAYVDVVWKSMRSKIVGTIKLTVTAHAVEMAVFNPAYVELGSISVNSKDIKNNVLVKRGSSNVPWTDISVDAVSGISTSLRHFSTNAFEISYNIKPSSLPLGPFRKNITIHFLNNGSSLGQTLNIPFYADIQSTICAHPRTLFLGILNAGQNQEGVFKIVNEGDSITTFSSIKSSDPSMTASYIKKQGNNLLFHYFFDSKSKNGSVAGCFTISLLTPKKQDILIPFIAFVSKGKA